MREKSELDRGKKSFSIVAQNKDIKEIQNAIKEAEFQVKDSCDLDISKSSYRSLPGLEIFVISLTSAFLTKFVEKFGESLADWLFRKLNLKESNGEKVILKS